MQLGQCGRKLLELAQDDFRVGHQTMLIKKKPSRDEWATKMFLSPKPLEAGFFSGKLSKITWSIRISLRVVRCGENIESQEHVSPPSLTEATGPSVSR